MPNFPKIKFNASAFGHTIVARRASRWLDAVFNGLGREKIVFIIQNNHRLLDYVPGEQKAVWKRQVMQNPEIFSQFSDKEVYSWVPVGWQDVIEAIPGGREWGSIQVADIRQTLTT